jgi:hypothetical protein
MGTGHVYSPQPGSTDTPLSGFIRGGFVVTRLVQIEVELRIELDVYDIVHVPAGTGTVQRDRAVGFQPITERRRHADTGSVWQFTEADPCFHRRPPVPFGGPDLHILVDQFRAVAFDTPEAPARDVTVVVDHDHEGLLRIGERRTPCARGEPSDTCTDRDYRSQPEDSTPHRRPVAWSRVEKL